MEEVNVFKWSALVGILIVTIISSLAPLKLSTFCTESTRETVLAWLSFFTGGVFMGAGMLHMLPDAIDAQSKLGLAFPYALLTTCIGFIFIWSLDKLHHLGEAANQMESTAMLAVAARAKGKGASICYVSINPVTTYGNIAQQLCLPNTDTSINVDGTTSLLERHNDDHHHDPIDDDDDDTAAAVVHSHKHGYGATLDSEPCDIEKSSHNNDRERSSSSVTSAKCADSYQVYVHPPSPCQSHPSHSSPPSTAEDVPHSPSQAYADTHPSSAAAPPPSSVFSSSRSGSRGSRDSFDHTRDNSHLNVSMINGNESLPAPLPQAHSHGGGHHKRAPSLSLHDHQHDDVHHHHIVISGNSLMLPLALAMIFSLHSFIEGVALGVQDKLSSSAISILIAISSHKIIEAISVSSNFVKEKVKLKHAVPIILVYCLMTPLGIIGGVVASNLGGSSHTALIQSELQAFAAGSFLYLTVHEINDERCCHAVSPRWQIFLVLSGVVTMALLAVWV